MPLNRISSLATQKFLKRFAGKMALNFSIMTFGKVLQLGVMLLVSRIVTLEEFGSLNAVFNAALIASLVMALGLPNASLRFAGSALARKDWPELHGFMRFSTIISFLGAAFVAGVGVLIWYLNFVTFPIALVGVLLTIAFASGAIRQGFGLSMGQLLVAIGPREIAAPLVTLAFLPFTLLLPPDYRGSFAVSAFVIGYVLAELIGFYAVSAKLPPQIASAEIKMQPRVWLSSLFSIWLTSICILAQQRLDLIFVAAFVDLKSAALYAAAQRLAQMLNVFARIVGFSVSPQITHAFHSGNVSDVKKYLALGVSFAFVFGAAALIATILLGSWALSLFGAEYRAAYNILVILVLVQGVFMISSTLSLTLSVTHRETPQAIFLSAITILSLPAFYLAAKSGIAINVALVALLIVSVSTIFIAYDATKIFSHINGSEPKL
jgi:O-antigen/teichoic acid export membrane protein